MELHTSHVHTFHAPSGLLEVLLIKGRIRQHLLVNPATLGGRRRPQQARDGHVVVLAAAAAPAPAPAPAPAAIGHLPPVHSHDHHFWEEKEEEGEEREEEDALFPREHLAVMNDCPPPSPLLC